MKQESLLKYFIVLLFTSVFLLAGCEKKTDQTEQPGRDTLRTDTIKTDTVGTDTSQVMNLQGMWRGELNERSTTLNITEFKDNKIKGTLTQQARQTYTQQVSGTFVPETRTVRLSDQVRNRLMGTYSGTISEDGTTFSGTFTTNADGANYRFNFKKAK